MRLWLFCALAAAVAVVAVAGSGGRAGSRAELGHSRMEARGREGRRRPHRPCSGCFSVLSEESQSMPWNSREEDVAQPGRRGRARREDSDLAHPMGHPSYVLLP